MLTDSNYSKGTQGQDNGLECVSIYNGRQSSCKERHIAPFKNYFLVLQSYVKPFCFLLMIRIMISTILCTFMVNYTLVTSMAISFTKDSVDACD